MTSKTLSGIRDLTLLILGLGLFASPCVAQQNKELTEAELVEYRPGDSAAIKKTWDKFYAGDDEAELPAPLVSAGKKMVPAICAAIAHPDMRLRRYAMSALGEIGDKAALPALEAILKDKKELGYMRGDALQAIHQIDKELGKKYAKEFRSADEYLQMIAGEILSK